MPALQKLIVGSPGVDIEILSREMHELPHLLFSGEVDFIVLNSFLEKNEIEFVEIGKEENIEIKSARHKERDCVYLDHDTRDPTTQDFFRLQGQPDIRIRRNFLDDVYGIIKGVELGFGRAVVSKHLVKNNKSIKILPREKPMTHSVVLHFLKRSYYSRLHSTIIDELKNNSKNYLTK